MLLSTRVTKICPHPPPRGERTENPVLPHIESTLYNVWRTVNDHSMVVIVVLDSQMIVWLFQIFVAPLRNLETSGTEIVMDLSGTLPRIILKSSKSSQIHTQAVWLQRLCSQSTVGAPLICICSVLAVLRHAKGCASPVHSLLPWLSLTIGTGKPEVYKKQ